MQHGFGPSGMRPGSSEAKQTSHAKKSSSESQPHMPDLSSIHEHPKSGQRPRRSSQQQTARSTGSDFSVASIDPLGSLELTPSRRTSNSAHLDEFSDMLMKRRAHPMETEAVKGLLRMDSSVSTSPDASSTQWRNRKQRRPRASGDNASGQQTSLHTSQDGLSGLHVESGSGIDPFEARSIEQGPSAAGGLKNYKNGGAEGKKAGNSDCQSHLGSTQNLSQVPSLEFPKVAYPGDPARFYTRFDSNTSREEKEPIMLQLPTTPSVEKNLTPLESMESFMSMIHPVHRDSCLAFCKGNASILREESAPRQVMNRNWMWEEVLHSLPAAEAEKSAEQSAFLAMAEEPSEKYNPSYVKYVHNDQTFKEAYWDDANPVPAYTLWRGPPAYPRSRKGYTNQREPSDLKRFTTDHGGGEGVAALLHQREKAEESFGYDWIHTVLTTDGRPFPWLPILVVTSWTIFVLLVFMVLCRFDRLILEDHGYTGPATEGIALWQRRIFMYMRGLEAPCGVIGTAVTFLLVFRVNTGYERWWEGRRCFREVVNHSRDLARQVAAFIHDYYLAEKFLRWLVAAVLMLKQHVREETWVDEARGILHDDGVNYLDNCRNKPLGAALRLSEIVHDAVASKALLPDLAPALDLNISDAVNSIGTCEMILTTPMPFAYVAHLRTFIIVWLLLLPPMFATYCGWITIIPMLGVLFMFLGLDSISSEIENPFGYDWNDLPLDVILSQLNADIVETLQSMLDIPLHKNVVTFADLAKFNVSTFGADAIIKHLSEGGSAVAPVFPMDSVFLRRFKHAVLNEEDSEESEEESEGEEDSDKERDTDER